MAKVTQLFIMVSILKNVCLVLSGQLLYAMLVCCGFHKIILKLEEEMQTNLKNI